MIGIKFTNNFSAPIASNISSSATTIPLATGYGALLPSYGVDEYEYITLVDSANHIEIVKVTARSGDTLTVVRAQDNTLERAWTAGDRMSSRPCAAAMYDALQVNAAKADAVHSHAAGDVALTPTGGIEATNLQAAIVELDGDIAGKQAALGYTAAQAGANSNITSLTGLTTPLSVAQGGTGATSDATAPYALKGANTDITSLAAPALGAATATTQADVDDSTKVATTACVHAVVDAAIAAMPTAVATDQGHNNVGSLAVVDYAQVGNHPVAAGGVVSAVYITSPTGLIGSWRVFFAITYDSGSGFSVGSGLAQRIS
jgi:hypothetical protein